MAQHFFGQMFGKQILTLLLAKKFYNVTFHLVKPGLFSQTRSEPDPKSKSASCHSPVPGGQGRGVRCPKGSTVTFDGTSDDLKSRWGDLKSSMSQETCLRVIGGWWGGPGGPRGSRGTSRGAHGAISLVWWVFRWFMGHICLYICDPNFSCGRTN